MVLVGINKFSEDEQIDDRTHTIGMAFSEVGNCGCGESSYCGVIILAVDLFKVSMKAWSPRLVKCEFSSILVKNCTVSESQKPSPKHEIISKCLSSVVRVLDHDHWVRIDHRDLDHKVFVTRNWVLKREGFMYR